MTHVWSSVARLRSVVGVLEAVYGIVRVFNQFLDKCLVLDTAVGVRRYLSEQERQFLNGNASLVRQNLFEWLLVDEAGFGDTVNDTEVLLLRGRRGRMG